MSEELTPESGRLLVAVTVAEGGQLVMAHGTTLLAECRDFIRALDAHRDVVGRLLLWDLEGLDAAEAEAWITNATEVRRVVADTERALAEALRQWDEK